MQVIRITKPGYDALTETDKSRFSLLSDEDNVLIKEKARGSGTVELDADATIAHNLGYIPFYLVWCEVATGRYRVSNAFNPLGSGWKAWADTTNLYIQNKYSSTYKTYKYFIFLDKVN